MAIAYGPRDIPNIERVTVTATDGTVAEWLGTDVLEVNVVTLANIDTDPHPIALAMGGYSIDASPMELTRITYGRASQPQTVYVDRTIDPDDILAAMEQAGYSLDDGTANALRTACEVVNDGGPWDDDYLDDDDDD